LIIIFDSKFYNSKMLSMACNTHVNENKLYIGKHRLSPSINDLKYTGTETSFSEIHCDTCDQCKRYVLKGRKRVHSDGHLITYCPHCDYKTRRRSSLSTTPINYQKN